MQVYSRRNNVKNAFFTLLTLFALYAAQAASLPSQGAIEVGKHARAEQYQKPESTMLRGVGVPTLHRDLQTVYTGEWATSGQRLTIKLSAKCVDTPSKVKSILSTIP